MSLTAVVINAGLGDLTIGLRRAGFHVLAAYDSDEKAVEIHRANIDTNINCISYDQISADQLSSADLLAAHLYQQTPSADDSINDCSLEKIFELLNTTRPKACLLVITKSIMQGESFRKFLYDNLEYHYNFRYQLLDVSKLTGYPVKEKMGCFVGTEKDLDKFYFPVLNNDDFIPLSQFVQPESEVNAAYYRNCGKNLQNAHGEPLLCWKPYDYFPTDIVQWNYTRVPKVKAPNGYRKITPQEVAALKGFPKNYFLTFSNRQWLYKKLMQSCNIDVIMQISRMISYVLTDNPLLSENKKNHDFHLGLLSQYFDIISADAPRGMLKVNKNFPYQGRRIDFKVSTEENNFTIEVLSPRNENENALRTRLIKACERSAEFRKHGTSILAVFNDVPIEVKEHCLSEYSVEIWDIHNLLWMFENYPSLRKDVIASFHYSVEKIQPIPPATTFLKTRKDQDSQEHPLIQKLAKIKAGKEEFSKYETVCVDIIKELFGEYLVISNPQETSSDGLYRFDLCCKIKMNLEHDFLIQSRTFLTLSI